jgi:hypothetical protein
MGYVQPSVLRPRFSERHTTHHICPNLGPRKLASLCASDGFDIAGEALFEPVLVVWQGRQRRMYKFMRDDPIRRELFMSCRLANAKKYKSRKTGHFAPCGSLQDTM